MKRTILTALLAAICCFPADAQAQGGKEPLAGQVKNSIDKGVKFLRASQRRDGGWEVDVPSVEFRGGGTALAVMALLNCGVPVKDPAVSAGLTFLRGLTSEHTYVRALQTMAYAEAAKSGNKEDLLRIQKNVDWLLAGRVVDGGGALLGWGYGKGEEPRSGADNSNSQYALLGLWAGKSSGANIDPKVWRQIREFYIRTQSDGSWVYTNRGGPGSLTMTTAGLCGLLIAGMEISNDDDGTLNTCGRYEENEAIGKALGWIGPRIRFDLPVATYYNLYGIERAGRLSGERFFGKHDWYRDGCKYLITQQGEDGSWARTPSPLDRWPVINSSFALLFLSKGRTPILISKVVHTENFPREGDNDWNNDRNDLRHLTQFASENLFKNQLLAWQTFDMLRARDERLGGKKNLTEAEREQAMLDIVSDMLQSPIMYITGHKSPENRFTADELELLRRYIDNGGFIFAEACCGQPDFDRGFKALVEKLWPNSNNRLIELGSGHPVWNSKFAVTPGDPYKLMGIDMGCKTVLIYSPKDMSCLWEANDPNGKGRSAFRLGSNIIAYATGLEPPQPRLTNVELPGGRDASNIPRGYFKVGQLKHGGDWQPAPKAMYNLMDHLRKHAGLDVALKTEELPINSKAVIDYKFVYMHGRSAFEIDPAQLENLRFNLKNGGLLFSDACCGNQVFDKSFRKFVAGLLPNHKLEPIPLDDALFSKDLNGVKLDDQIIRCRLRPARAKDAKAGELNDAAIMQNAPPMLEGIKIDNRWVVIYSKYDIGCALERHRSSDCLGYDTDSAFKIAGAAVLYLLNMQ